MKQHEIVESQTKFVKHLNVFLIIWWPKRYENVMENYGWLQLFCKWFVFLYKRCPLLAVNCCQYRLTKYKEGGSVNVVVTNKHGYVGGDGVWDWVARPSVFMQSGNQQVWLVWVGILTCLAATVQRENCGAGDQCCNNSSLLSAPSLTGQTLKPVRRASLVMRKRQMSNTTPPSLFCL